MDIPYKGGVFLYEGKPVYITSGDYLIDGRISNFWWWREINPDGSLGREYKGYDNQGKFENYSGEYQIEIKVILTPSEDQPK